MKITTKIVVVIAILYNAFLGYVVTLTLEPIIVLLFLSFDIFLIFYYLFLLVRYNYGRPMIQKDLLEKARKEVQSYGSQR